jgi:hypothetical protein
MIAAFRQPTYYSPDSPVSSVSPVVKNSPQSGKS